MKSSNRTIIYIVVAIGLLVYYFINKNRDHGGKLEGVWEVQRIEKSQSDSWLGAKFYFFDDSLVVKSDVIYKVKSDWIDKRFRITGKFKQTEKEIVWYTEQDTITYLYQFEPRKLILQQITKPTKYILEMQ